MPKKRILWCSQSPSLHTGYGIIAHDILLRLHATGKYDIACQGWFEKPHPQPKYPFQGASADQFPFPLYHTNMTPGESDMASKNGGKNIDAIIEHFNPDITVFFGDIYMMDWIMGNPKIKNTHIVTYFPVDGMPIPDKWKQYLQYVDTPITFSKFGQNVASATLARPVEMIYHGVDYPMWSLNLDPRVRSQNRIKTFGSDDICVFGMVARNQPRKNIPALYEAFSEHAKTHSDSRLLIHACPIDQGWNLDRLAVEFSITDKVKITPGLTPNRGVDSRELKTIYDMMDVHVNTAWGEGFGIPIIESMACGVPNIIPAYTVGPEFIGESKGGGLLKVAAFTVEVMSHIRRAQVDVKHLKETMDKLAEEPNMRKVLGQNAKKYAQQFHWPGIIKQWEALFDSIDVSKTCYLRPEVV